MQLTMLSNMALTILKLMLDYIQKLLLATIKEIIKKHMLVNIQDSGQARMQEIILRTM